jgi:hypothetical protein
VAHRLDDTILAVLRRELGNLRRSHAALREVLGPHIVPEAGLALAKLAEAADDLLEIIRSEQALP